MQELEQMIKLYHTAFIIFLILGILFLLVSVFLFFRFNIRNIFDLRTGRGAKKTIQKMEEINAQTGKLRQDVIAHTPPVLQGRDRIVASPIEQQEPYVNRTEVLEDTGAQETELLTNIPDCVYILNEPVITNIEDVGATVLLSEQTKDIPQAEENKLPGVFKIEKEIMWVHTEEVL